MFGIPLALIALIFDWKNVVTLYNSKIGVIQFSVIVLFMGFSTLRLLSGAGELFLRNFAFCLTLSYKAFIGFYMAYIVIYLIESRKNLIAFFILIQTMLIVFSVFIESLYNFLLLFQTPEATAVFDKIFGLRSLGLGVIHNEGIIAMTLLYVFFAEFSGASKYYINILGVFTYLISFSSRLVFVVLPLWQLVKSKKLIICIFISSILAIPFLNLEEGPLSQVFELYTYYAQTGIIGSSSTDLLLDMPKIPDSFSTWIIGDGQYFSETGFYRGTDIGFSRVIFFGGLIGLVFYLLLCCWPLFILLKYIKISNSWMVIFLFYVLIVSNVKGVNMQCWSFVVCLYCFRRSRLSSKPDALSV